MRNRASTPPRNEDEFIRGGSANTAAVNPPAPAAKGRTKSKPVTVSLTDSYLMQITCHLQLAAAEGEVSLTRTDVIKAGLLALGQLSPNEVISLLGKVKD